MFQKLGLVKDYFKDRGTPVTNADLGRYNVTKRDSDKHFFKVPTLRNVALTSPYLHDGSQKTLEETGGDLEAAKSQLAKTEEIIAAYEAEQEKEPAPTAPEGPRPETPPAEPEPRPETPDPSA